MLPLLTDKLSELSDYVIVDIPDSIIIERRTENMQTKQSKKLQMKKQF